LSSRGDIAKESSDKSKLVEASANNAALENEDRVDGILKNKLRDRKQTIKDYEVYPTK